MRMVKNISEQDIRKAVAEVKHPAIDCSLVDLGILKDITVKGDKAVVTIAFPFPNIPIRNEIINRVKEPIIKLGAEFEVKEMIMNQQERGAFLEKEQRNWRGNM
jgi:metal-sulfur cluster biosynthetic enzyme